MVIKVTSFAAPDRTRKLESNMSNQQQTDLLKTPLYDLHIELGAKMVPFAGYAMPVQYAGGIMREHLHTRAQAGLFDVSHMGQVLLKGADAIRALEAIVPVDVAALAVNKQTYALFTNEAGGILDDLIITRWAEDELFLVFNAACKQQDLAHLREHIGASAVTELPDRALLAVQGPVAKDVLAELAPASTELVFMSACKTAIDGGECYLTRSGYSGEDGFEISVPAAHAEALTRRLLAYEQVEAVGLGARDSLRLEAGLCLYGHDLGPATTPVEAALLWSISKSRRPGGAKAGGYLGADVIEQQLAGGVRRKRVGLLARGRAPVREGAELVDASGKPVGAVTSGGFGPTLSAPVAMGYVDVDFAAVGTELNALVRGKQLPMCVAKMPFVPQRYYRG